MLHCFVLHRTTWNINRWKNVKSRVVGRKKGKRFLECHVRTTQPEAEEQEENFQADVCEDEAYDITEMEVDSHTHLADTIHYHIKNTTSHTSVLYNLYTLRISLVIARSCSLSSLICFS